MSEIDRGNALLVAGEVTEAESAFRQALKDAPNDAQALTGLGNALIQLGREDEAYTCLDEACRLDGKISHALSALAWLALKRGDVNRAHNLADQTLALNPLDHNGLFVSAQALFRQWRFEDAERAFARAVSVNPRYAEERNRLANEAFDRNEFQLAARHYSAYAQFRGDDARAWTNLGLSLARIRNFTPARAALEKAVALAPNELKPVALLASVMRESGARGAEMIPVLRTLTQLSPNAVDGHLLLARALIGEHCYPEAKIHLQSILQIDAKNIIARWLDFQRPDNEIAPNEAARDAFLEKWRSGIEYFETIDWTDPQFAAQADAVLASTTDFYLAYLGKPLVDEHKRQGCVVRKIVEVASRNVDDLPIRNIGQKRRKVAVFSPSLLNHSVEKVWSGALLRLDPAEFELRAFCPATGGGTRKTRWTERGIQFEQGERSAGDWIVALRAFEPDIVLFLDIGMHQFVQAVASLRHAPVQATTWAHPVTSGISTIDYFLSGDAFEPDNASQHYSEQLIRLPRLGVYTEPPESALEKKSSQTPNGAHFICTQSAAKLHPAHDELFAQILVANPGSKLTIFSGRREHIAAALSQRMRSAFESHGIDFESRCHVHARVKLPDYYEALSQADICLDSLDFSGCLTSIDALWTHLPIVTLPGELMRGRQTAAMLHLIGLEELIAQSTDDYVRIATRLAADSTFRDDIVSTIRSRKYELFRDETAVDGLANFLRTVEHPSVVGG